MRKAKACVNAVERENEPRHAYVFLHHTLGKLQSEVHGLQNVLAGGTLHMSTLPHVTWEAKNTSTKKRHYVCHQMIRIRRAGRSK